MKDYEQTRLVLPAPTADAAILLRYDPDQPRYCRAALSGPGDSPYFGGLFVFDVFFPAEYPQAPPQLQFLNTNSGTERVHTSLYAGEQSVD